MDNLIDLIIPLFIYLLVLLSSLSYRFSGDTVVTKKWHTKNDRTWYESPYNDLNIFVRAVTGFLISFCIVSLFTVVSSFKRGSMEFRLGRSFKWAIGYAALEVVYCIVYNIWLAYNRPGIIPLSYDWGKGATDSSSAYRISWWDERSGDIRRQRRLLRRSQKKVRNRLKTRTRDGNGVSKNNKNSRNPRYSHFY